MPINLDICKKKSPVMMQYENKYCCIAFAHDYGGEISGLVVVKNNGDKIFTSPHLNIKLEDLKNVNGEGYKIMAGNRLETIPSKLIHRFVKDIQKAILRHKQEARRERRNQK